MNILEKINDVYYRLTEQDWDELSKWKMPISCSDVERIITGSRCIGNYKVRFSFSITEHSKHQELRILLFGRYIVGEPICIYEKAVVCNDRTINSAIEKLNTVLETFMENCHETGCYQLSTQELADVLKKSIK